MKRILLFAALMGGLIGGGPAMSAADAPAGDAQAGAAKAIVCQACHGPNGNSVNGQWPSLAGLGAGYIAEQLANFKSGKRNNVIMMPMAVTLSPQDMADLAAYFAAQVNTGLEADPSFWQAGQKLYRGGDASRSIPACEACHGPDGHGNAPAKFPALRGQHSEYVVAQLHEYATGGRTTGPNNIMQTIAKRLSDDDMRNVASFVQGLR
jgi:cytochrome c553